MPEPFPKLPPLDNAKLMPREVWTVRQTLVFLAMFTAAFAVFFWLGWRLVR